MQYLLSEDEYKTTIASNISKGRLEIINVTRAILSGRGHLVELKGNVEDEVKAFVEELRTAYDNLPESAKMKKDVQDEPSN